MPQTAAEHDFMPLEVLPEKPQDHFSTREWLTHLEETVLPAKPPARPRSAFVPTSVGQAVNLLQIGAGLGLSLLRRKPVAWGRPVLAMIEPTSLCNLKCPLCPSGNGSLTRERARLDFDAFKTIIDRLPDSIRMLQLWNQGEPFIVRELPEMIRYAKRRDVYIVTSTNGHYFRKDAVAENVVTSGIDEIIVSLDGADQAVYENYRVGGKIETVFSGVQRLVAARNRLGSRTPLLHLQFILMRQNLHQRDDMIAIGRKLGADRLSFKTLQVTDFDGGADFLPDLPELTRYAGRTEDGHYITQKRRFFADECLRLWFSLVINCDGRVSPCCFDKDGDHSLGNLLDEPFDAIWFGERYTRFREHLLRSRYDLDMCQDCTEGVKELFLQTIDYHQA